MNEQQRKAWVAGALSSHDGDTARIAELEAKIERLRAALRKADAFFKIDEENGDDLLWTPQYTDMIETVRAALNHEQRVGKDSTT